MCGESFTEIRADDGPAWLTILVTGHLIAPLFAPFTKDTSLSTGKAIFMLVAITVAIALFLLPKAKGLFISIIWLMRRDKGTH